MEIIFEKSFSMDIILSIVFLFFIIISIKFAKKTKKEFWLNIKSCAAVPVVGAVLGICSGGVLGYSLVMWVGGEQFIIKVIMVIMSGLMAYLFAWTIGSDLGLCYGVGLAGTEHGYAVAPRRKTNSKSAQRLILSLSMLTMILVFELLRLI